MSSDTAPHIPTIFVTGASGLLGQGILQHFTTFEGFGKTFKVIAGTRSPSKLQKFSSQYGIEVRPLDLENAELTQNALVGVDRLILISTDSFETKVVAQKNALDAAILNGVKHVFYTSCANPAPGRPLYDGFFYSEVLLASTKGIGWSILRNGLYTDLLLRSIPPAYKFANGVWNTSTGKAKKTFTTRDDLALAAALLSVKIQNEQEKRLYELTDDVLYSNDEVAELISQVVGKPLKHVAITKEEMVQTFIRSGFPEKVANAIAELDSHVQDGLDTATTGQLRQILGRAPTSLKSFIEANQQALSGEA